MKIQFKTIFRISAAAMALGLIFLCIGFFSGAKYAVSAGRSGVHILDTTPHVLTNLTLDSFESIDVNAGQANVEFIQSDHYGVNMRYYDDKNPPAYSIDNSTLKIEDAQKSQSTWFHFDLYPFQNEDTIQIYLPKSTPLKNVKVQSDSGRVQMDGLTAEKADLRLDFGSLELRNADFGDTSIILQNGGSTIQNVKVKNFAFSNDFGKSSFENIKADSIASSTIKADNGEISITNFTSTGPLALEDQFGDVHVDGMQVGSFKSTMQNGKFGMTHSQINDLSVQNSFGEINLSDLTSNGLNLKNQNGSISLDGALKGISTIKSDFGKVTVKTSLAQSSYNYDFSTYFGKVKINGQSTGSNTHQNTGAENSLTIQCQNGGIGVNFPQ